MRKTKITIFITFLVTLVIFLAAGCNSVPGENPGDTGSEFSSQELAGIVAGSIETVTAAATYKATSNSTMNMTVTGSTEAGDMTMTMDMDYTVDETAASTMVSYQISVSGTPELTGTDAQDIHMDLFVIDDYFYMGIDMPVVGVQWVKVPATTELLETYDINMLDTQLQSLGSAVDIEFSGYETIDGENCYVLTIKPVIGQIMTWIGNQVPAEMGSLTPEQVSEFFDEINYKAWIGTDTSLLRKMDIVLSMNMTDDIFSETEHADFESMAMDVTMTMSLYDYGIPVDIILPAEAENAIEMSPGDFLE